MREHMGMTPSPSVQPLERGSWDPEEDAGVTSLSRGGHGHKTPGWREGRSSPSELKQKPELGSGLSCLPSGSPCPQLWSWDQLGCSSRGKQGLVSATEPDILSRKYPACSEPPGSSSTAVLLRVI